MKNYTLSLSDIKTSPNSRDDHLLSYHSKHIHTQSAINQHSTSKILEILLKQQKIINETNQSLF